MSDDEMMTVRQVCEFFGGQQPLDRSTIDRWVASGKLAKPIHLGHRLRRWRRSDCQALLEAMASAGAIK